MSSEIEDAGANKLKIIVDSMTEKIKECPERLLKYKQPIISRIPHNLRAKHGSEYDPKIIAIGPYHRNNGVQGGEINTKLLPMEEIKLQYLIDLCKRDDENRGNKGNLQTYITAVHEQELNARKLYLESSFEMSSEDFVEMLVLDGCFIVELLLSKVERKLKPTPMAFQMIAMVDLRRDLLLFENQIPFFILEEIYAKTNSKPTNVDTFLDLALRYLHQENITKETLPEEYRREEEPKEIHHLLHLSHLCLVSQQYVPKDPQPSSLCSETTGDLVIKFIKAMSCWKCFKESESPENPRTIPTATKLKEAGVQFRKKKINGIGYLEVSFEDGIMEIPTVSIDDSTSSHYRNLLAMEQACKEYGDVFRSYVVFMDSLIDTVDDVALLMESKIIENNLGSAEEVATFFNEMCFDMCFDFDNHYLAKMFVEINKYYNKTYNKWRAKLMHDYLNSPWAVISLLGVFVLLGLTAVQTVCSVIGVQNGK